MAKIYTDKESLQKDIIEQQATDLHHRSNAQAGMGSAAIVAGVVADNFNLRKGIPSRGLGWFSSLAQIIGIVELVKSYFTSRDAHKLELERQRMGPQEVVLLPEQPAPTHVFDLGFANPERSFASNIKPQASIEPQTLAEHAANKCCGEHGIS